jgi:hypothetical protein
VRIVDILGPLEAETLFVQISSENVKIRSLVSTFFKCKIPLERTANKSDVLALDVKPLTGKSSKIVVGLLWHACFGRKFKTYHWYILFRLFTRTLQKSRESEALLAILCILTANAEAKRWQSNLKPLRSILVGKLGDEQGTKVLNDILKQLPYQLPKKGPKIDDLLDIRQGTIRQRKPKELVRIGVGYKDKGNLPKGSTLEFPNIPYEEEIEDQFDVLLRQVKMKYLNLM